MDRIQRRRRTVAVLEELKAAGLLLYALTPNDLEAQEVTIDVFSTRERASEPAPRFLSRAARNLWEGLRSGALAPATAEPQRVQ